MSDIYWRDNAGRVMSKLNTRRSPSTCMWKGHILSFKESKYCLCKGRTQNLYVDWYLFLFWKFGLKIRFALTCCFGGHRMQRMNFDVDNNINANCIEKIDFVWNGLNSVKIVKKYWSSDQLLLFRSVLDVASQCISRAFGLSSNKSFKQAYEWEANFGFRIIPM